MPNKDYEGKRIRCKITSIGTSFSFGKFDDNIDFFIHNKAFKTKPDLRLGDIVEGEVQFKTSGKNAGKMQLIDCEIVKKGFFKGRK